ncbi:hypothetical protein EGH21_06255 [Halomicroarcula sp. F13]|uniref:PGF-CTERM sorting domain-containing protein n=1 Tax=Haloarcula rubra TaxID=2487747 RepID=A0AAW4PM30_9EURY|nr:hypothetical protein [Halomicroarcula rubra]MBX0322628.1 hypothetical protein [Halomicroarcula rubra]
MPTPDSASNAYSRRAVLGASASVLGGSLLASTSASARTTTKAVVADGSGTGDLTGFFVHFGQSTNPVEAQTATDCGFADWPDDETTAYDVTLIDRARPDYEQYERTVYVPDSTDFQPGNLYVVNSQERCTTGYVGVRLVQLGSRQLEAAVSGDAEAVTETSGGSGAGFGVVAALAAALGVGARRGSRDD